MHHDVGRLHRRTVDHAVDHILGNLATLLDLSGIAATVGYSPWHFQRVFSQAMGESPAAFVARARVERAVAIARAEPDRPWGDIAWEVGFPTPSQMSRAFRQRYGLPARTWDRSAPLVGRAGQPGGDDSPLDLVYHAVGHTMPVAVEQLPHFRFAYRRVKDPYTSDNLATAWDEVASWRSATTRSTETQMLGMSWDDPATVPIELCRYDLGIVIEAKAPAPAGASERLMPSTSPAVLRVDGGIEAVGGAWDYLHRVWLPSSPRRRTPLPSIERFHTDPRPNWDVWHLDCILPVAAPR